MTVHGFEIRGGMVYAGQGLRAPRREIEPALIDSTLPVDNRIAGGPDEDLGYWPAYDELTPGNRAVYLAWLTGGRRNPSIPIGYVFLFMYGLERRILVDILADDSLETELPAIRAEMTELLATYGAVGGSFQRYAMTFLGVIDALLARRTGRALPPPDLRADRYEIPATLRIELGRRTAQGLAIPADLALAWAWYLPEVTPRTPATRCANEFSRLFAIRFDRAFPNGLIPRPVKARVEIPYIAASAGLREITVRLPDVPDVFGLKAPGRKLAALFEDVTNELDPYSRWLGRNPEGAGSLASFALLPPDLMTGPSTAVDRLRDWATGHLGRRFAVKVPGGELLRLWESGESTKLSKADSVSLAQLLGNLGVGVEPDVRFGGSPIAAGSDVVLFRSQPDAPHAATQAYGAAATLVHLAAAVGIADGGVSNPEVNQLGEHLRSSLSLSPAEMGRLYAHFLWLSTVDIKLTGLQKRLAAMTSEQRQRIGDVMVSVASADGVVSPAEVTMLGKIFRLLGLDPAQVTSHLHASLTGGATRAAVQPVVVRPGGQPEPGYRIPPRPAPSAAAVPVPAVSPFSLDNAAIQKKMAETAEVGVLLGNLFMDEDDAGGAPKAVTAPVTVGSGASLPTIGGLDGAHSLLLRAVAKRGDWNRAEFEDLTAEYHLLPDGAIDMLNEVAYETCGEPVIEGDDDLTVNTYAVEALLA